MEERSENGAHAAIGLGLRAPHFRAIEEARPAVGWFEVHAENYMDGGPAMRRLLAMRRDYRLSIHGVGLSLGSAEGIDPEHLERFKTLVEVTEPLLVSDHLSWSVADGVYLNDLLPLPYTEETLEIVARNVMAVQEALKRPILVENPSRYLSFRHSVIPEPEFLAELVRLAGCGVLCDVNNIFVSASNFGLDAFAYLEAVPASAVGEIHLAGHSLTEREGRPIRIDDHASIVCEEVWLLYRRALDRFGLVPTLIEWDKDLPPFETLLSEAEKARRIARLAEESRARAA